MKKKYLRCENYTNMIQTIFEQRIKSRGNHKPNRHRKSHGKNPKFLAAMKLKMAVRNAQNKHKKVVSKARNRRGGAYDDSEDILYFDLCEEEEEEKGMREEAIIQDMVDRDW